MRSRATYCANEAVFATLRSSKYLTKSQGGGFFELDSLDQRLITVAEIAQLGERYTEDLKVPGSIAGFGSSLRVRLQFNLAHLQGDSQDFLKARDVAPPRSPSLGAAA